MRHTSTNLTFAVALGTVAFLSTTSTAWTSAPRQPAIPSAADPVEQAPGPTALPTTPAGDALRTLIETYNTGKHPEPRWARWFSIFGPVDVGLVERSDALTLRAWLRGTITRRWLGVDLRLDAGRPTAPPQFVVLQLGGALPPELRQHTTAFVTGEALTGQAAEYLKAVCGADYFSGTVMVTVGGRPIVQIACGLASRRYSAPNRLDTRFSIASVGKTFTAVAILQLAQTGRLTLTDRLDTFLPDYPIAQMRAATVAQLLTHTSGIGRADRDWIADRTLIPLDTLVEQTTAPPLFAPGTSVRYSNEAFLLLGRIVEITSGEPYHQYIQRHIFDAAGMAGTSFLSWDEEVSNVATPYSNLRMTATGQQQFEPGPRRNALMLHGIRGTPAGGAFSTAPDLAAFAAGLRDGRLLDAAHAAMLSQPVVRQPPPFRAFSYGVEIGDVGGLVYYGKSGGAQGVSANWLTFPSLDMTLVVLSNYDQASDLVMTYLTELVTGASGTRSRSTPAPGT